MQGHSKEKLYAKFLKAKCASFTKSLCLNSPWRSQKLHIRFLCEPPQYASEPRFSYFCHTCCSLDSMCKTLRTTKMAPPKLRRSLTWREYYDRAAFIAHSFTVIDATTHMIPRKANRGVELAVLGNLACAISVCAGASLGAAGTGVGSSINNAP